MDEDFNETLLVLLASNFTNSINPFANGTSGEGAGQLGRNGKINKVPLWYETGRVQIPLYAIIFLLAVIGNTLVIVTLVQNQRMRTITNLFLLNLAISDLLLGVLCMPFTLIGALLRDFVFGEVMCKLLPFLQACTVSVGVWTLVAISVERYYAICHPLRSLRWQTISHAYKLIMAIWLGSIICMGPIALLSQLKPTNQGNHKCRENWPSLDYEKAYNLFLDVILFVIPLLVLAVTYSLITFTLCRGMKNEEPFKGSPGSASNGIVEVYVNMQRSTSTRWNSRRGTTSLKQLRQSTWSQDSASPIGSQRPALRRSNVERNLANKKRVIKMLLAVVLEFFICWTPLYIINTIVLFDANLVYTNLGYTAISFLQLLAYSSSCCNPITYCFMNYAFRKAFLNMFTCTGDGQRRNNNNSNRDNLLLSRSEFSMDAKYVHRCTAQEPL